MGVFSTTSRQPSLVSCHKGSIVLAALMDIARLLRIRPQELQPRTEDLG